MIPMSVGDIELTWRAGASMPGGHLSGDQDAQTSRMVRVADDRSRLDSNEVLDRFYLLECHIIENRSRRVVISDLKHTIW